MKWISVIDQVPNEWDDNVLAVHKTDGILEAEAAYYFQGEWYTTNGELISPSHWMPIPKLPKI